MRPPATCHPERTNKAFGLCISCYKKQEYKKNPEKYREKAKAWRKKNPDKFKEQLKNSQKKHNKKNCRKQHLKTRFKLSVEEYLIILERQKQVCKICMKDNNGKNFAVDHDHKTGTIRGLLCQKCNIGLGMFDDNIGFLEAAIVYLKN